MVPSRGGCACFGKLLHFRLSNSTLVTEKYRIHSWLAKVTSCVGGRCIPDDPLSDTFSLRSTWNREKMRPNMAGPRPLQRPRTPVIIPWSSRFKTIISLRLTRSRVDKPGNAKGGSITVQLTSCLTGLESAVWLLTIFVFICKTD